MPRLVISRLASDDEAGILADLAAKAGVRTALKFRSVFDRRYRRLPNILRAVHVAPSSAPRIRIAVVVPYIIFYSFSPGDGVVIVLRVLHGNRNYKAISLME